MPRAKKDCIGETRKATCGQMMTIIAYRNRYDMDVQFEDGTIRKRVMYKTFKLGTISNNPKTMRKGKLWGKTHLGESKLNKYGDRMTIVEYDSYSRIVVQFENGDKVLSTYQMFDKGSIANPTYKKDHPYFWAGLKPTIKVGDKNKATNGMTMTVVGYRNANDIDILFETGYIKEHCTCGGFRKGEIGHPTPYKWGDMTLLKRKKYGYLCRCEKCGIERPFTVQGIKKHKCRKRK